MKLEPAILSRAVAQNDYFRRPRPEKLAAFGSVAGHKEWLHFVTHVEGVDVLANFSIVDDVRPGARPGSEIARIVSLVRGDRWDGDIDQYDGSEVAVRGGRADVAMGESYVRFLPEVIELKATMKRRAIDVELVLRPDVMPNQANTLYVAGCPAIHWLSVPRLTASGRVVVGDRAIEFRDALAYHDHNWGNWRWGQDFAWEWGYAVPDDRASPWTLIYVRLTNRGHTSDLSQSVFLWRGQRQHRFFRPDELRVVSEGRLRPREILKLPRVMGLVSRGRATDIPKRLHVSARRDQDWLDFTFESEDVAQVILPNDDDLGVTIINEVSGSIEAAGEVGGEPVTLSGRTIFEFLSD